MFLHRLQARVNFYFLFTGILIVICFHFQPVKGQFYNGSQLTFGRSRMQYNEFFWTYYRFNHFDTYFYLNGKELAQFTALYANAVLPSLEKKLEAQLEGKVQFIIYNSLSDLKQSNIGYLGNEQYNTGGITHIIGKKIFLYFDGSHVNFQKQIRSGLCRILLQNALYGSSFGSQVKNNALITLPDWYINGLVSYYSEDWNTDFDNRVRDGFLSGKYLKFNQISGTDALYAGHSIWKFISDNYGTTTIPSIIYMTKVNKGVENGFSYILGLPFKKLIREWQDYYMKKYVNADSLGNLPAASTLALKKSKRERVYAQAKICPDNQFLAYTTNELGQYKIWLKNLETGKTHKIFKRGYKLDEKVDYSYPLLAWHPTGQVLAFIIEAKGQLWLYMYSPEKHRMTKQGLFGFQKVLDFSYSSDGKSFAMSAVQRGQSDIYVYNIAANSFENITKDIYDDLNPRFINHSSEIIFSSNRPNDTINFDQKKLPLSLHSTYDIFVYNYSTRSNLLRRITQTPVANETMPMEYAPGFITYLSNESGISNRYLARRDSAIAFVDTTTHYNYFTISYSITNYTRSILEQDISLAAAKISEVVYAKNRYNIYLYDRTLPQNLTAVQPPKTPYMLVREKEVEKEELSVNKKGKKADAGVSRKRFVNVYEKDISYPPGSLKPEGFAAGNRNAGQLQNSIGINQNVIDTVGIKRKIAVQPAVQKVNKPDTVLPKQRNYNVEYSIDKLVSQIDFNFLNSTYQTFTGGGGPVYLNPGTNALLQVGITDLLEDYRITGGVRLNWNLINNEYLLSIANYKGRMDKELVFHRQTVEEESNYSTIRHHTHEMFYILTYPLDQATSLRTTLIYRNDQAVYLSTDYYNLQKKSIVKNWAGIKGEYVFDATREVGLNLYYGTRYKIFGEYYQLIDQKQRNMVVLGMDFRNYQKIHRTFIWANRFAASTSLGNSKLIYYMGGVDNWLFPSFMTETPIDYSQNYVYQTLATNMRGFKQNIRNGNSFVVINSELRFPVFRYILNRPLKSEFLNNFQVIGFGDIGTAWTGVSPFGNDNFLYTKIIQDGPMTITVKIKKEPIVGSYGIGLRSKLLGYFVRADYAWGVEDKKVNKGLFYLSLSLDF